MKKYKFDAFSVEYDKNAHMWKDAFPACEKVCFDSELNRAESSNDIIHHLLEDQNFNAILSLAQIGLKGIIRYEDGKAGYSIERISDALLKAEAFSEVVKGERPCQN